METAIDIEGLKKLYSSSSTARSFLEHSATRKNNQSETTVKRILAILRESSPDITRADVTKMFQELEKLKCGQFVLGRKGWESRFVWQVGIVSVGRAACGEPPMIEGIPDEEDAQADADATLKHTFNLRQEFQVIIDLPADFSKQEADRLALFIKSLPFDTDQD